MTITQQGILALLKSAVTSRPQPLPEGFDLAEAQALTWEHNILPLVYQGAYLSGISPELPLMQQWHKTYFQYLLRSEKQMRSVAQLCRAFEAQGIDYMPVKGCTMKARYPQPEMRPMGDADILIRMEQYGTIRGIMESLGYREGEATSYHIVWQGPNLMVELHSRFYDRSQRDLCGYFGDGWLRARHGEGCRYTLTPEDDFAYVFSHMTKHFRTKGIGLRHMLDVYVYRRSCPELSEQKVEAAMEAMGLLTFYRNILRLLDWWFEGGAGDPVTEYISDYVFGSGSGGTLENLMYSSELLRASKRGVLGDARWYTLFRAVFPTLETQRKSYKVLGKYPWLYPVFWFVRLWEILRHRRGNIRRRLRVIGKLDAQGVSARRRRMDALGLDYSYENP